MSIEGVTPEVLERYVRARKAIGNHADRIVAISHLLALLEHCDGVIEVDPSALAVVGDMLDQDICDIQEQLDEFIFPSDAEEAVSESE